MVKIRTERATFKFKSWGWTIDRMEKDLQQALKEHAKIAEQGRGANALPRVAHD
jgi:hypothetical protein